MTTVPCFGLPMGSDSERFNYVTGLPMSAGKRQRGFVV